VLVEYMPPGLSEEEAIQDCELVELSKWERLGVQLHATVHGDVVVPSLPAPQAPASPAGLRNAVSESLPHAPLAPPVGWGYEPP
jgi:hypothetical protein